MKKSIVIILTTTSALGVTLPVFAEGTPWLQVPQTLNASVSHVSQEATRFFRGETEANLPFGRFEQETKWFDLSYGINDKTALDLRFGFSDVDAQAAGKSDDRMDTTIGITRLILDEFETGDFSLAVRVFGTLAGDYETGGSPATVGDGADAVGASLLVGKFLTDRFAIAADGGVRMSNNDVPNEWTMNLGGHFAVTDRFGVYAQYQLQKSSGDLDIGTPEFKGRFPEVQENVSRVRIGGNTSIGPIGVDLSWYQTLDGRNTADFDIVSVSISYTMDFYKRN